jgi:hypothetical protein
MPWTASEQQGDFFCDREKAFDCVKHGILLLKMEFYAIIGKDKH